MPMQLFNLSQKTERGVEKYLEEKSSIFQRFGACKQQAKSGL